jgi:hypothetical protein
MEADIFISVRAELIQQTHALPPNSNRSYPQSMNPSYLSRPTNHRSNQQTKSVQCDPLGFLTGAE